MHMPKVDAWFMVRSVSMLASGKWSRHLLRVPGLSVYPEEHGIVQ